MAKEADPAAVVETIRASIEASRRGSRRVRAHRFRELFGYQAWSAPRREHVERLLKEAGIVVQPGLGEAGRDDWLVMSMPTLPEVREEHREPRPPEEWFAHLEQVRLDSSHVSLSIRALTHLVSQINTYHNCDLSREMPEARERRSSGSPLSTETRLREWEDASNIGHGTVLTNIRQTVTVWMCFGP